MLAQGVGDVVVGNRRGALHAGTEDRELERAALAADTNKRGLRCPANEALSGADVLPGPSGPGTVSAAMAAGAIVFAMANPVPEVRPQEVRDDVAIIATGRSDYPNQINNVLAFPGVFNGALEARAHDQRGDEPAAHAITRVNPRRRTAPRRHHPQRPHRRDADPVAEAVANTAVTSRMARRERDARTHEPATPPEAPR
jgi:malate dehydrogenase (oxaloacetate-decarboxylating)